MKLLFDENLSHKLVEFLGAEYPGSVHVRSVGLRGAEDAAIWSYARDHNFVVVSKDNDFRQLSFVNGAPPKVVWLEVGNAGTAAILDLLRRERGTLEQFQGDPEAAMLVVSLSIRAA